MTDSFYGARHLIENFFVKIKQFRAVATRVARPSGLAKPAPREKTARNFLAAVHLVASIVRLN